MYKDKKEQYANLKVIRELLSWIKYIKDNNFNVSSTGLYLELEDRVSELSGQIKIK